MTRLVGNTSNNDQIRVISLDEISPLPVAPPSTRTIRRRPGKRGVLNYIPNIEEAKEAQAQKITKKQRKAARDVKKKFLLKKVIVSKI
jgi:hypothetical protein